MVGIVVNNFGDLYIADSVLFSVSETKGNLGAAVPYQHCDVFAQPEIC